MYTELLQKCIDIIKSQKIIPVGGGISQGNPISPKLFVATIQEV